MSPPAWFRVLTVVASVPIQLAFALVNVLIENWNWIRPVFRGASFGLHVPFFGPVQVIPCGFPNCECRRPDKVAALYPPR